MGAFVIGERLAALNRGLSVPRIIALIGGGIVLICGALVFGEHPAVSPGKLSPAHRDHPDISASCRSCHTPFQGTMAGCVRCHGGLRPNNVHAQLEAEFTLGCAACHQEHSGERLRLVAEARAECLTCHAPQDIHDQPFHAESLRDNIDDSAPAPAWDVLGRIGDFAITPWFLVFLGLGTLGYVAAVRFFPAGDAAEEGADEDVAPQRVPEMPVLSPQGESSVPGIFIVGECAGVPLINRAMKSGFDAIDFIVNRLENQQRSTDSSVLDVVIAGAGPAGLGAATKAQSLGISYVLCEKGTAASTIKNYPRAKLVQAAPVDIPEYGTFFQEDDETKEGLVRRWEDIIARTGVIVNEREEVASIKPADNGELRTQVNNEKQYQSRYAILAIGNRGTPRRLGVPGERPERVSYLLIDAADYRDKRILVVGGGNSACEAALALSSPDLLNDVTLSYRGAVLRGVTPQNSQDVDKAEEEDQIRIVRDSRLREIRDASVVLDTPEGELELPNDCVFALIGAELPTKFLRETGIKLKKKGGV